MKNKNESIMLDKDYTIKERNIFYSNHPLVKQVHFWGGFSLAPNAKHNVSITVTLIDDSKWTYSNKFPDAESFPKDIEQILIHAANEFIASLPTQISDKTIPKTF
jgi:hypothetical protein